MNLSVFFSCLALLQILKMPVKRTLPSMTRMTMLKSRSSKCFAGHGSAVVTSVKSFWGWKLWAFALVLHTDKGEVLISVVVYFFAECTRTNWPLWRDSCSNYKKVITVFFPPHDWIVSGIFQMWTSLSLSSCGWWFVWGWANKAQPDPDWLLVVVVRVYIIRQWRQLQREFESASSVSG